MDEKEKAGTGIERKDLIDLKEPVVVYENDLKKSNLLIGAKYRASLMELRITYAGLYALQEGNFDLRPDGMYVTFNGAQLIKMIGLKGNSLYSTLEATAKMMMGRTIGWSNPETREFEYATLIDYAQYKEGSSFVIRFNSSLKNLVLDIKKDFTPLNRSLMMQFKSAYSFRLYELLKKQCYYPKGYKGRRDNVFKTTMGLSELKFEMGVANAAADEVKKVLQKNSSNPDYDKALEKSPEKIKSYGIWQNFKMRCLEPAVKEINEISDIYVTYETERNGRGGKITTVTFIVYLEGAQAEDSDVIPVYVDEDGNVRQNLDDNQKFIIWSMVANEFEMISLQFTDIQAICDAAEYDMERIKNAAACFKSCKSKISNPVGWIVSCIKKGGYDQAEEYIPESKPKAKKTGFSNFDERKYDYDELETLLLNSVPQS